MFVIKRPLIFISSREIINKMLRVLFGVAVGVYLAQNYDVPDMSQQLDIITSLWKEFEKTHAKKGK